MKNKIKMMKSALRDEKKKKKNYFWSSWVSSFRAYSWRWFWSLRSWISRSFSRVWLSIERIFSLSLSALSSSTWSVVIFNCCSRFKCFCSNSETWPCLFSRSAAFSSLSLSRATTWRDISSLSFCADSNFSAHSFSSYWAAFPLSSCRR